MARKSSGPRYFASKNGWFAEIGGERKRLTNGPKTKESQDEANKLYDRLKLQKSSEIEGDKAAVAVILNAYLRDAKNRLAPLAPNTWKNHRHVIEDFCGFEQEGLKLGHLKVRDLKKSHFTSWLAYRREYGGSDGKKWSENYCHMQLRILRTAFYWAAGDGELLSESPLARKGQKMKLPTPDLSLKRLAITDDEHGILLAYVKTRKRGNFGLLLEILYETGARPAEISKAYADEWHPEIQAFVLDPNDPRTLGRLKNRRHLKRKGRKRIIRVPDYLVPSIEEAVAARVQAGEPAGPIIRTERGKSWVECDTSRSIAERFKCLVRTVNGRAKKKDKEANEVVRKAVSMYSYRHAYVTRWLKAKRAVPQLCEVLNTSISMIQDHYSHLLDDHADLLREVNAAATRS